VLFIGLSLLYFTRPTGVFFLPATLIYIVFQFYKKKAFYLLSLFLVIGILLFFFLINITLNSGGELDFLKPYNYEMIICGIPTIKIPNNIANNIGNNEIGKLWFIITNHTTLFISLAFKRLITFYGVIRNYYALPHNIFIAILFYTTYVLGILNLKNQIRYFLPQTIYFICLIFLVTVTVILSCDEWHNRFILSLLPFFLLMSSNVSMKIPCKN
jgi:hypothetical protein